MELRLDYITLDGDLDFDILLNNHKVGQLTISNDYDSYIVMAKAFTDFYIYGRGKIDTNLEILFNNLYDYIDNHPNQVDLSQKPLLLLEDECIGNRYAITHNLARVPRWCGYYLKEQNL